MSKEAPKQISSLALVALFGLFDKENLLFGFSTAALDGDGYKISDILEKRARQLGATDEEIVRARLAAIMTKDMLEG